MENARARGGLLEYLKRVKDGRRREGRVYPLWSILGMLVLAGLNGQKSLRSMCLWCGNRWRIISRPLGFTGQARPPSYGTVWYALTHMDIDELEQESQAWAIALNRAESEGWSIDGKVLRGSRREHPAEAALQVVTMVAQTLQRVVGQEVAEGEDQVAATLQLLKAIPLNGQLVTMDAGLLHREVANTIVEQGGNYLGPIKNNEPTLKEEVDHWMKDRLFPPGSGAPGGLDHLR